VRKERHFTANLPKPRPIPAILGTKNTGRQRRREEGTVSVSTFELNWEVGLVTAEAVHGFGFAMELELEDVRESTQNVPEADLVDAAD